MGYKNKLDLVSPPPILVAPGPVVSGTHPLKAGMKSAASAASPKTKIQESRGASGRRLGMRTAGDGYRLPWIPGFWSFWRLR